jgi:hypothetical protein
MFKLTIAKALFGVSAVLFVLALLSIKVADLNLVTAGLACLAAGFFLEGVR